MIYFNASMAVFVHEQEDADSFRMFTAQFCVNGNAKQADMVRASGVSKISLKRAVKRYREEWPNGGPLFALPALLAVGLLGGVQGYYGLDSLLLLVFIVPARLESIESLRYSAPGGWGNLLGLDRNPEVL